MQGLKKDPMSIKYRYWLHREKWKQPWQPRLIEDEQSINAAPLVLVFFPGIPRPSQPAHTHIHSHTPWPYKHTHTHTLQPCNLNSPISLQAQSVLFSPILRWAFSWHKRVKGFEAFQSDTLGDRHRTEEGDEAIISLCISQTGSPSTLCEYILYSVKWTSIRWPPT